MSQTAPIALYVPSLRGGGAERVALNLARGLVTCGAAVHIVAARAEGPFLAQLPAQVQVRDLHSKRVLGSLRPLTRYLKAERPRALISFMDHANVVALWARRAAGVDTRVIATVHNTLSHATRNASRAGMSVMPLLIRRFYPWADAVVAVSGGVADDMARETGFPRDRVEVIYNPVITPELMEGLSAAPPHSWLEPGQPPVILGVGRLTAQKDFANLIRAFGVVRRARPARLIVLGEGEERAALQALIAKLDLGDSVLMPGFVTDAQAYMAHASVFALSSAWEGLPTVLIEALAAGAAVVSTNCPSGPQEILRGGQLGALVPPGDAEALAAGILRALEHRPAPPPPGALEAYTQAVAVGNYLRVIRARSREGGNLT